MNHRKPERPRSWINRFAVLGVLSLLQPLSARAAEPPANLVTNPGFEQGAAPWVARGPATLLVSTQAHTGAGAAWVTNRTATWQGVAQSLLGRMRPGGSYVCAAWARAESITNQSLKLSFEQHDAAGTRFFNVASTTVTNNAWTYLSGIFSLNVTGALSDIIVYVEGPAAGVELRVDNVVVVPLAGYRRAAAGHGVMVGGVSGSQVNTDLPFGRVVGTDFHIAGTENALKFSSLHPGSNTYSFGGADAILDHATAHGQLTRGHTLLWHSSVPNWVASNSWTTAQLQSIAFEHIDTVVNRYRDRVFCWDVVNEAFNDNGTIRSTVWYDTPGIGYAGQGTKYIEEAFKRARAADPDCELFYNDYSAETDNAKSDAIYAMAQDFVARGVPIDGIGFQFHLSGTPSLSSMRANFQRFNDLGLKLHLTELDVRVPVDSNGVATAAALAAQADTYFTVVGTALAFPRTTVVQTWGFSDRYSWIPGFSPGNGAALTLDEDLNRKPAWWALRDVLANQAETLAVATMSAGDSSVLVSSTSFSAGSARQFLANAANDFITFAAEVPYRGEYNVRVGVRKNSASGIFQLAVTRGPGGTFVNLGAAQDTYAAATSYTELNLGSFTFTSAGTNSFRFTVTGKNGSSTDYDLTLDYLRLTPTGADGNQPPALSPLTNQTVNEGEPVGPLTFAVSDRETTESALAITLASSNPSLLPTNSIAITGGGGERWLVATPAANRSGVAVVTVTATDAAGASASNSFVIGVAPRTTSLVATGAVWKFDDSGANLGTAWRSNSYSDAAWSSGPSMLGFGDANGLLPSTVIASNRQITTYFRTTFTVPPGLTTTNLNLRILRDDAAVVYLDGAEIWRDTNITSGVIAYNTTAMVGLNGAVESTWLSTNFPPTLLNAGSHLLAAEVHQNSTTSSDLTFNLELTVQTVAPSPVLSPGLVGVNQFSLAWPGWAAGYALKAATDLTPPVVWVPLTNPPALISNDWRVTLPITTNSQRFFGLQAL